jgi:RNA polymerase sigma factor (sigma-70 family)
MQTALISDPIIAGQNERLTEAIHREQGRLRNFIRRRVADEADAEDILQDVFYEFIEAYRLMKPIEQAGAWLFQVARNRIIDRFRKKKPETFSALQAADHESGELLSVEEFLPSLDESPEAAYARSVLLDELDAALDELPDEQREVFLAHEIEGTSFKELSARTGVSVNTLLSHKRHAVVHLRQRLQTMYEEQISDWE